MENASFKQTPRDLASLVRGLYERVARKLDVDASYVSRVARGERTSEKINNALRRELNKIVERVNRKQGNAGRKRSGRRKAMKQKD